MTAEIDASLQWEAETILITHYFDFIRHESALGKTVDAFERAKAEYLHALQAQIETAKKISFVDVFPKSAQ